MIGRAVVAALRERGDTVVSFVRPDTTTTTGEVIRWDPSRGLIDDGDLDRSGRFNALIHLAGAGIADRRWSTPRRHDILFSRTASTSLLASAFASKPPEVVASGSAIGWYGSRGEEILDEASSHGEGFLAEVCVAWEDAIAPLAKAGSKVAILRTGIVQDRFGGALRKQLPLFRLGLGGPLASGRQWLSPISLRDEVAAILHIVDQQLAGPFNLVAPAPVTNATYTRALGRALRRPAFFRVPPMALKLALGGDLAEEAVLASQRVVPARLSESGFRFADHDLTAILNWALTHSVT
jgi:uncharacterized protein